jgi:hypothetical protein
MSKFLCAKVRTTAGAITAPDGHSMPCRAWHVQMTSVEEPMGPQWGIADVMITVLHECHFVEGQIYELDFER